MSVEDLYIFAHLRHLLKVCARHDQSSEKVNAEYLSSICLATKIVMPDVEALYTLERTVEVLDEFSP
jgi:hypothetical protein